MAFDLALRDLPYEVVLAASGQEGLEAAAASAFDLIYLDLRMPDMDGVTTLRRLREAGFAGPIYIVTAFHKEFLQELVDARQQGIAFELLQKPLERDQIIMITRTIVEGAVTVYGN
jgi:CheY-like chemotaxis protein